MVTSEERLTTLEKTVALLQKSSNTGIQELNRNVTMLLGIASSQQLDIKEIKISLITIEERLDTMSQHIEGRFDAVGKHMETLEGRFEIQEKKFDHMLHVLTMLTKKPE